MNYRKTLVVNGSPRFASATFYSKASRIHFSPCFHSFVLAAQIPQEKEKTSLLSTPLLIVILENVTLLIVRNICNKAT